MSVYSSTQICGDISPVFSSHESDGPASAPLIFCRIDDGKGTIHMEAKHIRALATALDAWEAEQAAIAAPAVDEVAA